MRSGFVAGDAALMKKFLLYRTYHGSAMSPVIQQASIAAWGDEKHVVENRNLYREKFAQVTPMLAQVMDVQLPDAGFYLWAGVGGSDAEFARDESAAHPGHVAALGQAGERHQVPEVHASQAQRGFHAAQGRAAIEVDFAVALVRGDHEAVPVGQLEQFPPFLQRHDGAGGIAG